MSKPVRLYSIEKRGMVAESGPHTETTTFEERAFD